MQDTALLYCIDYHHDSKLVLNCPNSALYMAINLFNWESNLEFSIYTQLVT